MDLDQAAYSWSNGRKEPHFPYILVLNLKEKYSETEINVIPLSKLKVQGKTL